MLTPVLGGSIREEIPMDARSTGFGCLLVSMATCATLAHGRAVAAQGELARGRPSIRGARDARRLRARAQWLPRRGRRRGEQRGRKSAHRCGGPLSARGAGPPEATSLKVTAVSAGTNLFASAS